MLGCMWPEDVHVMRRCLLHAGAVRRRDAAAVAEAQRMERKRKATQKPAAANKARRGAHSAQAAAKALM